MFNKYYQDELAYLREMGREYALYKPDTAGWLAEPGVDPDVERLLEGFAFLTARIREKLDDELPEFTHALVELLWPHYLRPIPSMTIMQFSPAAKGGGKLVDVPIGVEVASEEIEGVPCVFRTTAPVQVAPIVCEELDTGPPNAPFVRMKFKVGSGATLDKLAPGKLRLYLSGDRPATRALYLSLLRYLKDIRLRHSGDKDGKILADAKVVPCGFADEEALEPTAEFGFPGFRLLHEYFAFPQKFLFVELQGLAGAFTGVGDRFELLFELTTLPHDMPPVSAANVQTNCTPAVNLFKHDADPIRVEHTRTEYKLRPAGKDAGYYEIYSIESVRGIRRGQPKPRVYRPFFSFFRPENESETLFYKPRRTFAQAHPGTEVFVTFLGADNPLALSDVETISSELMCTNRQVPKGLGLGAINKTRPDSPSGVTWRNITAPTASVRPPLEGELYWCLLSHLAINYTSLMSVERLRQVLKLYDFRARVDRQAQQSLSRRLEGIEGAEAEPDTQLYRGATVRGVHSTLSIDEDKFGGEGEAYLFGSVMNEFLAHYVAINSFCRFTVKNQKHGEVHTWPPRSGHRAIL